jgi:hypothetical protein
MKIKFNGHSPSEREVEISQEELSELFKVMCNHFLTHIEYGTFKSRYPFDDEEKIASLCEKHQVDVNYTPDRLSFFREIVKNLRNPYECGS